MYASRSSDARRGVRRFARALALAVVLPSASCSNQPPRVPAADWRPQEVAEKAFELFDANGDAVLDEQELSASPGLASAAWHLDANDDQCIGIEELQERFALYKRLRVGLMSLAVRVTLNGRPLPGSEVRLTPEPFLEGIIGPATGTTDANGVAYPKTEGEDFPGVGVGFFRVAVDSPHLRSERQQQAAQNLGLEASPVSDGEQSSGTVDLVIKG